MTVQYIGNNLYELHIGHQKITLSKDEIDEVIDEFISEHEIIDKKDDEIYDLEEKLSTAERKIYELEL